MTFTQVKTWVSILVKVYKQFNIGRKKKEDTYYLFFPFFNDQSDFTYSVTKKF